MMLEELQRRKYSAITTRNYLRVVTANSPSILASLPIGSALTSFEPTKAICCESAS
jgi:hypothetical protein